MALTHAGTKGRKMLKFVGAVGGASVILLTDPAKVLKLARTGRVEHVPSCSTLVRCQFGRLWEVFG
jgi:hypothetical protein